MQNSDTDDGLIITLP